MRLAALTALAVASTALLVGGMLGEASSQESSLGQVPKKYRTYFKAMIDTGYEPVIPASTEFQPGLIYRLETYGKGAAKRERPRPVCETAFTTGARRSTTKALTDHTFSDNSISAGLEVAPGAVATNVSAALSGNFGRVKSVKLNFGEMPTFSLPLQKSKDNSGAIIERVLTEECKGMLQPYIGANGRLTQSLFIVVSAVTAEKFTYSLEGSTNAGINLNMSSEGVATGEAGWKMKKTSNQSFEVARDPAANTPPIFFAAEIKEMKNISQLGSVSGGDARDRVEMTDPPASTRGALIRVTN